MGHFIQELTYGQVQPLLTEDTVVVLPIGGGSKEHGNHLPMGTDYYTVDWTAKQITEKCDVITLPTLPYAYFPAFVEWKGSISVGQREFTDFVEEILKNFIRFGVWKFLIIDGGVSTHPPLCYMARDMLNRYDVTVAVTDVTQLGRSVSDVICEQKKGGHGDEEETSTMLYVRENLVHMEYTTEEYTSAYPGSISNGRRIAFVPNRMDTPCGTNGNSCLATKEKGEKILNAQVQDICNFLETFIPMKKEKGCEGGKHEVL
ncbi:creatininase family protein [Roseburia hominis]